jgi:hypothetical protein
MEEMARLDHKGILDLRVHLEDHKDQLDHQMVLKETLDHKVELVLKD